MGSIQYLTYLRDRLTVARDLLADSGSIFVQIGDENVHRVRSVMDEVFGEENFIVSQLRSQRPQVVDSTAISTRCHDYRSLVCKESEAAEVSPAILDEGCRSRRADRYIASVRAMGDLRERALRLVAIVAQLVMMG